MTNRVQMTRQLNELLEQRDELEERIGRIREQIAAQGDAFEEAKREGWVVAHKMHDWRSLLDSDPFPRAPVSIFFLGAVSGEWAAQSRYRGDLPGFGGFLICAGGLKIVVDPGRSTLAHLHAAGIHPRSIDFVISTHNHWDCTRDLALLIMAATHHNPASGTAPPKLSLLASKSVLHGQPMDVDQVMEHSMFPGSTDGAETRRRLHEFPTMGPPAVSIYDLFMRLRQRYQVLDIGRSYELGPDVHIRTRPSCHSDTFGLDSIPGLDILVRRKDERHVRIVYLSDTEYHKDLAPLYAAEDLGPIDVLICNVKTLNTGEKPDGPYRGYTARHLGWQGLLQVTWDLQKLHLLTPQSLVVPRAWGIETVTRLDPADKVMTATPGKLRVYQESYIEKTGQPATVPGLTWVAVGESVAPRVRHFRRPFPEEGAFGRFGTIFYRSEAMAEIVRCVQPVVDNPDEILLIMGETGTGKDALAQSIHLESMRSGKRIIVNAKALAGEIGFAALTGYKAGAYTEARKDYDGLLKQAAGGTLVIEEAAELPLDVQIQLLTILGDGRYSPMRGEEEELTAQVILTTTGDIGQLVKEGRFRIELANRIHRRVVMPPLRERLEDIPAIAYGLCLEEPGYQELAPEAIELLKKYSWPGNVRSLRFALQRVRDERNWSLDRIREEADKAHSDGAGERKPPARAAGLRPYDRKVYELVLEKQPVSRRELEAELGNSKKKGAVVGAINRLIRMGLIRKLGGGPTVVYEAAA